MPDKSTEVRLKHLLDTKEIRPEEYKLLMKSIPKPRLWIKMFEFLMNPFEKISYTNSITTIILSILLAGYSYYCTDFMHLNKNTEINFLSILVFPIVLWYSTSIIFWIFSVALGGIRLRNIDFIVFCGLAIFPIALVFIFDSLSYLINPQFINPSINVSNSLIIIYSSILDTIAVILLAWYVVLNYFAFKNCSGLNHHRTWLGFTLSMVVMFVLLKVWVFPLIKL